MTGVQIAARVLFVLGMEKVQPQIMLNAINAIYKELWELEMTTPFVPLKSLPQAPLLPWRCFPALVYGTAALVCLDCFDDGGDYQRYLELYVRALPRKGVVG